MLLCSQFLNGQQVSSTVVSIRSKLFMICGMFIIAISTLSALVHLSLTHISELKDDNLIIKNVEVELLTLRRNEKDFFSRKELKYQKKFDDNALQLSSNLIQAKKLLLSENLNISSIDLFAAKFENYKNYFQQLVNLQKEIGLTSTQGLYGELRNAVHLAEDDINALAQHQLLASMLMLRRHEKDFMLRNQEKYLNKFKTEFEQSIKLLNQLTLPPEIKVNIQHHLKSYQEKFRQLTHGKITMGLSPSTGLIGQLRHAVHDAEQQLIKMERELQSNIDNKIQQVYLQLYSIAFSIMLLTLIAIVTIIRTVQIRITAINKMVLGLASGEISLQQRLVINGKDEVAMLASNFNHFICNISDVVNDIIHSIDQLSTASNRIDKVIYLNKAGNERQQSEISQANVAMLQMQSAINEIAEHAVDAANGSVNSDDKINESINISTTATNSIYELVQNMKLNTQIINEVNQESENIGSVLQVISDIAEQTNLLALNAAIEAARAGENGRGFAVVADEVRNLAKRTQLATQDISSIIEGLQSKAKSATEKVKLGVLASEINANSIQELSGFIKDAKTAINNTSMLNNSIAVATEEQTAVSSEICKNINQLDQESKIINQHSIALEECRIELSNVTQLLDVSVQKFRTNNTAA